MAVVPQLLQECGGGVLAACLDKQPAACHLQTRLPPGCQKPSS